MLKELKNFNLHAGNITFQTLNLRLLTENRAAGAGKL